MHVAYGHPKENWFPWLKKEFEKLGCRVFIPHFPTPEGQNLENWLKVFKPYEKYVDENTIFIGHSLGPAFILRVLERLKNPVKACFFVAGFTNLLENPALDEINKTFVDKPFDWKRIRANCKNFFVFHSDNDPYVPLKEGEKLAKNLGTKLILVKGAEHFNEKAGYIKFERLLEKIKSLLS